MNDKSNKTSICSIVFLDIIDYSKKTDSEQIEIKNQFNALINLTLKDAAENDRIILDTGDGAAIAVDGSPEDALFILLTIRDEILKNNTHSTIPLYVRFGINLGPVRVVKDINGRPNIIGDGINVAQRIMSFAKPNQILVSRSYYEVTSRLTQEISKMFNYSGVKHDKHVREHEIYSVRLVKESAAAEDVIVEAGEFLPALQATSKKINWKYALLATPALLAFFLIIKSASEPSVPAIIMEDDVASGQVATSAIANNASPEATPIKLPVNTSKDILLPNETIETVPSAASLPAVDSAKTGTATAAKTPEELAAIASAKKKAELDAQKNTTNAKPQNGTFQQHNEVVAVSKQRKKDDGHERSGWRTFKESIKIGTESKCSQAQIAMNQCNQQ